MAKAIKLKIEHDFNFLLIGLVTSEPIYRLSWLINESTGIKLAETKSIQHHHKKTKELQSFSVFSYEDLENGGIYDLIQNKGTNGLLIEEQKNIDYLFKVAFADINNEEFLNQIKVISNINLAHSIEPGSLKSKSRLISSVSES